MGKELAGRKTDKIKIGAVAKHFDVSVDLLRLYEREGLLLPIKSNKGTRYFTTQDYEWISTLLHLVRESGLNFAGIRYLLALLPCWTVNRCSDAGIAACTAKQSADTPCWAANERPCQQDRDCYGCTVYRLAPNCANLKTLFSPARVAAD